MVFGRWSKRAADDAEGHALERAVRKELHDADDATIKIVTAVAGLLGGVAYADRGYSEPEEERVRHSLAHVHGLSEEGIRVILRVMREHILDIATVQAARYSRVLREEADRDLRLEVLDMLVEIAAADGKISHDEVTLLRNTTQALGLDQSEYNELQTKHRAKLTTLR